MFIVLLVLLLFYFTTISVAEEARDLSLQRAVELALQNNRSLQQALELCELRERDLELFKEMYEKNLTLQVNSNYTLLEKSFDETSIAYPSVLPPATDLTTVTVTWLQSADSRLLLNQNVLVAGEVMELVGSGSLRYSYDLLKNFERDQDYHTLLQSRELSFLQQKLEVRDLRREIKYGVIKAYYNLLRIKEQIKNSQEMVDQNRKTLEIVRARVEAGEVVKLDELEAELQMEKAELSLENARASFTRALLALEDLLRVDLDENVQLEAAVPLPEPEMSVQELTELAIANNSEVVLLQRQINLKQELIAGLKRDNIPEVQVYGELGWQKQSRFPADYRVGINLNYNFNSYQNQVEEQGLDGEELALKELENSLAAKKEQLVSEINRILNSLEQQRRQIAFTQKAIGVAEKSLEVAEIKYQTGLTTISDLMVKQMDLNLKKQEYVMQVLDYNLLLYELKKTAGIL